MRFFSALSEHESTAEAADALVEEARASGVGADLAYLFFTGHHAAEAGELLGRVTGELEPGAVVGCSAEGVIGPTREVERAPAAVLMVAELPGVNVRPFHVAKLEWRELLADGEGLVERMGAGEATRGLFMFGDPFSTPTVQLLPTVDQLLPGVPVVGGMASSARGPGENILICNEGIHSEGLVGVSLSGAVGVQTVVSQGCRPIGKTYVITKARENVIETLGGRPALQALRDAIMDMPEGERGLLQNGLFIGRAISEYKERFGRGDFLVRNVMGVDNAANTVAVGDYVRTGQTVQFHVRDAATATEDLSMMLSPESVGRGVAGALLFSCNGRGCRLFEKGSHDVAAANGAMPGVPVAGFFAAGELGPVAGKNFIHGHTASFALFREKV